MGFAILTLLAVGATLLGLAFHRFWTTRPEARANLLYVEVLKRYFAWLALRTIQMVRRASPRAWWAYVKGLALWDRPLLEKVLLVCLYGSFLCLAASGFFFALFIPRGLYGFPLIGHVTAGGLFAVSLAAIVLFKGRAFLSPRKPDPLSLDPALFSPKTLGFTPARLRAAAFWLFILAGLLLTVTALLPMLPWLRTPGQKLMFDLHRAGALLSLVAAIVFVGLEIFNRTPAASLPGDRASLG